MAVGWPEFSIAASDKCEPQVARIVSVQGRVEAQKAGEVQWQPAKLNDTYCSGDTIRVQEQSRAALVLINETILRLDQNTTATFPEPEEKEISLLDLLRGAIHFFSRVPRTLKVNTPFVNAAVEGTEFLVEANEDQAILTVFEGEVVASNETGRLVLRSGESAVAMIGEAPKPRIVARPRDAVQWALYYPPIIDYRPADFAEAGWQGMVRQSIELYREGDLAGAFASIQEAPGEEINDPRFFTYRAALLLTVGRVDEASKDIGEALRLAPDNGLAFALQAIIAVVQNRKGEALELARQAVGLAPGSAGVRVTLSYAQQANFDLEGALASLQEAVELSPDNALAWARLSELRLSVGNLDKALEAANQAVSLNPSVARTQTVLGFAFLTQTKVDDATTAFEKAIELDQAAPLPRLGLGLAKIRQSDLEAGRREIEIAVSLDPNNSLIRSYVGKAYYEEKRDKLAASQYATAKELDPLDPTPWFYDAIRKQTINRPAEALQDLQKSIELNDNRAVYRSRLLLDGDLAARSASLGRIYRDLGFEQLALAEGRKSVNTGPSDYSGHRFLADTYSALPRHEIARVSELLQSQLLQPINITPVQPQLAESNLSILSGAGPSDPAFNEFNPLFQRNRYALQANGITGSNSTDGYDIVQSGVQGRVSYSVGQFRQQTDGFRENNDLQQDVRNGFVQASLSPRTSIQAELRKTDVEKGDLELTFTGSFSPTQRETEEARTKRFGVHHAFTPRSEIMASLISQEADVDTDVTPGFFELATDVHTDVVEIRHFLQSRRLHMSTGAGSLHKDGTTVATFAGFPSVEDADTRHKNVYVYSLIDLTKNVALTAGLSADFLDGATEAEDRDQLNPKLGVTWNLSPRTTIRAAVFRTLQRPLISQQNIFPTLEPTQVAGFNQFFLAAEGDRAWRYGVAIDKKFSTNFYGGLELSASELDVVFIDSSGGSSVARLRDWEERLGRAYLYWTPHTWLALSAEYLDEWFKRDVTGNLIGTEEFAELQTRRVVLGARYFHPSGFRAGIKATYVDQDGDFVPTGLPIIPGDDQFWVVGASIGYRLQGRRGLVSLEVKNLLDEEFDFQDTDPGRPQILPERLVFFRFTLSF